MRTRLIATVVVVLGLFAGADRMQAQSNPESRAKFVLQTVPQMYPKLIRYLRENGREIIEWRSQSNELQKQFLFLNGQRMHIRTSIPIGPSPGSASKSSDEMLVEMVDANLDGRLDSIAYIDPDTAREHIYKAPFDDTSQFLWDTALAIAFKYGKCCG